MPEMISLPSLVASIPAPPFRNLEFAGLTLHGYGLCLGLGIVIAIGVADWVMTREHVDTSRWTTLAFIAVVGGFLGSRFYHVASEPTKFIDHPGDILKLWQGGLGIYGAIAGGALVGLGLAPRFGIPRGIAADAAAPAFLIAQAIGRTGNYLNQELFGRPFNGPWALEVDLIHRPSQYADVATFHPTFLYEALGNLLLFGLFIFLVVRWRERAPGILLPLYVAAYSVVRIIVEPMRIDTAHEWQGVRQNVWVAGALIALGVAVTVWMQRRWRAAGSPGVIIPGRAPRGPRQK